MSVLGCIPLALERAKHLTLICLVLHSYCTSQNMLHSWQRSRISFLWGAAAALREVGILNADVCERPHGLLILLSLILQFNNHSLLSQIRTRSATFSSSFRSSAHLVCFKLSVHTMTKICWQTFGNVETLPVRFAVIRGGW